MKIWKLGLIVSAMAAVLIAGAGVAFSQPRPLVRGDEPARGPAGAAVTVVVFCDFQCPYCRRMVPVLERLVATYPADVRLVYRHFPVLRVHPDAARAAEAGACAQDQGRFWEMYASMFANQQDTDGLTRQAGALGLDTRTFAHCLATERHREDWQRDQADARALGVTGTPTLFVNGTFMEGVRSFAQLDAAVRAARSR